MLLVASVIALGGCPAGPTTRAQPSKPVKTSPTVPPRLPGMPGGSPPSSAARAAAAPRASTPAPIPSLVVGKAACDACFDAELAGVYLTPQGVGHYLLGCDDDSARKRCAAAATRSLPARVKQLVATGSCPEALALAQLGERKNLSSVALRSAVAPCQAPR
jgi:hypothetical protein